MSSPIPISNSPSSHPANSTSPTSSVSLSPQTPFYPNTAPNATTPTQTGKGHVQGNVNGNAGSLFKWASSFSAAPAMSAPKDIPVNPTDAPNQQKGFSPGGNGVGNGNPVVDIDHHDENDSFEFADFNDLKTRAWRNGRRAVSMSVPGGPGQSGITAMLSGFGSSVPADGGNPTSPNMAQSPPTNSMLAGGVLADKAARGQGVLRRLSMTGGGFSRPTFLSPPVPTNLPSSPPKMAAAALAQQPSLPPPGPPVADTVQRSATTGSRGRRFSESGSKKRGVSPMGERLLRDHGHF